MILGVSMHVVQKYGNFRDFSNFFLQKLTTLPYIEGDQKKRDFGPKVTEFCLNFLYCMDFHVSNAFTFKYRT